MRNYLCKSSNKIIPGTPRKPATRALIKLNAMLMLNNPANKLNTNNSPTPTKLFINNLKIILTENASSFAKNTIRTIPMTAANISIISSLSLHMGQFSNYIPDKSIP